MSRRSAAIQSLGASRPVATAAARLARAHSVMATTASGAHATMLPSASVTPVAAISTAFWQARALWLGRTGSGAPVVPNLILQGRVP